MGVSSKIKNKAVFLDRDGVLNRAKVILNKPYPPSNMEEMEILPGAKRRMREVADAVGMTAEEFDVAMYDLVNFMTYIAEPMAEERKHIGRLVLLFLLLLLVFVMLLNREYWKGIH